MLGKLLKYDFRSMFKQFAIVWPAAIVLALMTRLMLWINSEEATKLGGILMVTLIFTFVAILITMFVLSMVFIIQRFYKGLLGDEGYLMHTLPVKSWQLITSKLLCAVVVTAISILVAMLSIFLLVPASLNDIRVAFSGMALSLREIFSDLGGGPLFILEFLLAILVGMVASYLQLYAAMSIGHLFSKNRVLMSVTAYFAINIVISTLTSLLGIIAAQPMFELFNHVAPGFSAMAALHTVMWSSIGGSILLGALFFLATNYILSRRLNLE